MISLGIDLKASPDLGKFFTLAKEEECLAQDLVNRLQCTKGMLFYAPNYGENIRKYLGSKMRAQDAFRAQAEISAELKQDERVASCKTTVEFDVPAETLTAFIEVEALSGVSFTLVVFASAELVTLLRIEQQ